LDPTGEKSDAELNDALRRAGLLLSDDADVSQDTKDRLKKFKLDELVTDEGSNFSAGK
jgi:hypothetical protein